MTLTMGTGPFGQQSSGAFNFDTSVLREHTLYLEDCLWRVRAVCGTETVADSRRVKRLHETGHPPVYYFPMEDVCQDLLEATDHTTHCPVKGDATYWSVRVGDRVAENAVWGRGAGGCRPLGAVPRERRLFVHDRRQPRARWRLVERAARCVANGRGVAVVSGFVTRKEKNRKNATPPVPNMIMPTNAPRL